jgi:glycine oxidase
MHTDYKRNLLIVGQGLAGSIAALSALTREWQVTVVDNYPGAKASRAAAGILNPITGPRLHLSWNIDATLPAAEIFYRHWEKNFAADFFERKVIRRIFRTQAEVDYHYQRLADILHQRYLSTIKPSPQSPFGECRIQAAVLNIPLFLQLSKDWLQNHANAVPEKLSYDELELKRDAIYWRGIRYEKILFCEGHQVSHNPWFGHLPFKPAKGQSIAFRCQHSLGTEIISAEKWLLPQGDCHALAGSTYEWQDLDEQPTQQGRDLLLRKVTTMLGDNSIVEVTEHHAGIRPCSHDRCPYVGIHPRHPTIGILNGLGSKGTLFAPWCADQWLTYVGDGVPLNPAIDIKRCRKAWRNQMN